MRRPSCFRFFPVIAGVIILGGILPTVGSAVALEPFQAQIWDKDITLPAGAYRASTPIEMETEFQMKLEPGAFLDHIEFDSTKNNQHWHLQGAFLRNVKIAVQLGATFEAADSIFENCAFSKTGGWFTEFWGTTWHFSNCVISRQFMVPILQVFDYAVSAKDCTFIGVKLPSIGLKKKWDYFQGDNVRFENCRFVECSVPETFLAGTVNCVFDHCTFPSPRTAWPEATPPISVKAFYLGLPAPPSYVNGPLTVTFSSAPAGMNAGTKLSFSMSSDHVVTPSIPEPEHFLQIGTRQKKRASEISL